MLACAWSRSGGPWSPLGQTPDTTLARHCIDASCPTRGQYRRVVSRSSVPTLVFWRVTIGRAALACWLTRRLGRGWGPRAGCVPACRVVRTAAGCVRGPVRACGRDLIHSSITRNRRVIWPLPGTRWERLQAGGETSAGGLRPCWGRISQVTCCEPCSLAELALKRPGRPLAAGCWRAPR